MEQKPNTIDPNLVAKLAETAKSFNLANILVANGLLNEYGYGLILYIKSSYLPSGVPMSTVNAWVTEFVKLSAKDELGNAMDRLHIKPSRLIRTT